MDQVLLTRVLVNVLDNAIKYSPPDAVVQVTARQVDAQVEISVADQGQGISPEDLSQVFDKFYRVQRPDNGAGTGLSLSICRGIVEAHGGHIRAEERSGGGTVVTFSLPLV
jgi:two-component system sensor histidine kinase KdpD